MKKRTAILLMAALLLPGCKAKEAQPSQPAAPVEQTEDQQTKTVYIRTSETLTTGDSVTRTDYLLEDDQVTQVVVYTNDVETMRYDVTCDENGNYVEWVSDDIRIEYTYDSLGRLLGNTCYHGDTVTSSVKQIWGGEHLLELVARNGSQETRTVYTYNDQGQKIREELYLDGVLWGYSRLTLDDRGRFHTQTTYKADGTEDKTVHYEYDGNTATVTTTLPDGTLEHTTVEVFDDQGNLLKTTDYDGQGQMTSQKTFTWTPIQVPTDCPRASV